MSTSLLPAPATGRGRRTYRASGSFTVPAGVYSLRALLVGGGGGAGGASATGTRQYWAGPGGGGWPFYFDVPVIPGDVVTIAVGAGGAAGATATVGTDGTFSANGTQGSATSIFVNSVLVASAAGGGYGGGAVAQNSNNNLVGNGGNDSLGSGGANGGFGCAGPGGGYCGGLYTNSDSQRIRYGRRTTGRDQSSGFGGTNGHRKEAALSSVATETALVEAMLTQPLRLQYGAGGIASTAATPGAPPANSGQGGEGAPAGGTSTAGASGLAQIEWEVTAA